MIRAIIFDCFGVLITDSLQLLRNEIKLSNPEGESEIGKLIRAANLGVIDASDSNQAIAEILQTSVDELRAQITGGEVKDQTLLTFIGSLRSTYKTGMLSNIPASSIRRRFSDDELEQYFDVVVASGEIGFAKPEPQAYEIVADRLGVRCEECVFIDDREAFCEAAAAVGMKPILYKDFYQFKDEISGLLMLS